MKINIKNSINKKIVIISKSNKTNFLIFNIIATHIHFNTQNNNNNKLIFSF